MIADRSREGRLIARGPGALALPRSKCYSTLEQITSQDPSEGQGCMHKIKYE